DLRLAVRPQPRQCAGAPGLGQPATETVRQHDRERHQLGRLATGEADHHALVAGALELVGVALLVAAPLLERVVDAGRDVARLLFEVDLDHRVVGVETYPFVVVADAADGVPNAFLDVEVGGRGDLADDDAEAFGDGGLAS